MGSQPIALRRKLLRWYDRHRRRLPWRESCDPYRIWISEVMLQQTRVQAVIPFYKRFLRQFPDVRALARASEQALLASWSGLGYYSRARNLRKAAEIMAREWEGKFPKDYQAALGLPGVGDYTARAVLSIAYGIPLAVLDGNVARVLSRLHAVRVDARSQQGRKKLLALADALLSRRRPGDSNQAMMELGATVCLPQQPRCPICPLRRECQAYARGEVEKYPPPRQAEKPRAHRLVAVILRDEAGRCLLVPRPKSAQWMKGFWELPMWESDGGERASDHFGPFAGKGIVPGQLLGWVRHTITNNQFEVCVYEGRRMPRRLPPRARWVLPDQTDRLPVTTITRKALALLR